MPPPLHVGAPPSVHPVSGSLLPPPAYCLPTQYLLGNKCSFVFVALACGAKGSHPTQVRPTCILHPFAHPDNLQPATPFRPTTCHHFSSGPLVPLPLLSTPPAVSSPAPLPDHPRQTTPPQCSLCPTRPWWAVSRAQPNQSTTSSALQSSATSPLQPSSPRTLWSLSTIGVWPRSSRLKTWFGRRTGLLARPAKNTEQSITFDKPPGTRPASICYLWIQGSGGQWGCDGSSRDLCEEQRQRCEAKLYLPPLWRNRSGSRAPPPPCSPHSRG